MSRKEKTLEQRISELIEKFGITKAKAAIDMAYYMSQAIKKSEEKDNAGTATTT